VDFLNVVGKQKTMSITTKEGDSGETDLCGRKLKSSLHVQAVGQLDELNSWIGFVLTEQVSNKTKQILNETQKIIFDISSVLCGMKEIEQNMVETIENNIKELEQQLEPLTNFITPGGTKASSKLHITRTVARRSERVVVALSKQHELNPDVLKYFNRLSDLLFLLARFENEKTD
jgi:cob(I)alamin adenosyltransferase